MKDNLNIMKFFSFIFILTRSELDNGLSHMLQQENAQLAFSNTANLSFSTFKMFIGRRKDAVLDKDLNKTTN